MYAEQQGDMKGDLLHAVNGTGVDDEQVQGNEMMETMGESEIWQLNEDNNNTNNDINYQGHRNNLLDDDDDDDDVAADCNSFFYNDFPPLPDFPCMSSSSSSSSTQALTKRIAPTPSASSASSSSSAASWAVFKADDVEQVQPQSKQNICGDRLEGSTSGVGAALSSTGVDPSDGGIIDDVDCMDVMEDFGYMDLIDGNDFWDPATIFQQTPGDEQVKLGEFTNPEDQGTSDFMLQGNSELVQEEDDKEESLGLDELGTMFFQWLKTNKEHISAEDMRNIKLKRSTIECASKRLGCSKEGRKQLLKLILEWVEQYQLQKKRSQEEAEAEEAAAALASQNPCQEQPPFPNPNPNFNLMNTSVPADPSTCFTPSWMPPLPPPPPSYVVPDPATVMSAPPHPVFPLVMGYNLFWDPYVNGGLMNCHTYSPLADQYQMLDPAQIWQASQFAFNTFTENGNFTPIVPQPQPMQPLVYGDQPNLYPIFNGNGVERLSRLGSSATREARKKRMARQRRVAVHHPRHHHHPYQNQHHNDDSEPPQNCTNDDAQANPDDWMYTWSPAPGGGSAGSTVPALAQPPEVPPSRQQRQLADTVSAQPQSFLCHAQSDRRQQQTKQQEQQQPPAAYKGEKNLKFLLQKVLKQSDVGSLGRIVLPKKEAETQLPELEARDGMTIAMEDIGTSKMWNMRYRFWPNNKSRMYLLENTGDFVKANGLQEGDFIVIYSDAKSNKYMIRGVKVRQQGQKAEGKKPVKRNHRSSAAVAGNGNFSKLNKH